jgi:UDP-N-acetylglucosamine 2-epimerase (non-hydrolysing)
MVFIGTRPEIVKMAPVIKALENDKRFQTILVDSGQHYDEKLSSAFFDVFRLPQAQYSFEVGSVTHAKQTGKIMIAAEQIITEVKPDIVLAQGDTNTVLAAALAAVKTQIPFGHIEAGLRSFDRTMPEEINRMVADQCSEIHFAPTSLAAKNLLFEGVDPKTIHITGNTNIDAILQFKEISYEKSNIIDTLELKDSQFGVVTIHRPSTVDNEDALSSVVSAFIKLTELKLVLPVHPRTRLAFEQFGLLEELKSEPHIVLTEPLNFLDFLHLMSQARIILTDSGGLQEEAFTLGKPCITLRTNTERPESVMLGANFLVGRSTEHIIKVTRRILADSTLIGKIKRLPNPFGDGHASERIIEGVARFCKQGHPFVEPQFFQTGTRSRRLIHVGDRFHEKVIPEVEQGLDGRVLIIYDEEGHPVFPQPDQYLTRDQYIVVAFDDRLSDD